MHLGRFHAAVNEVVVAFGEEQTLGKYENFMNTLQASVSDPNNASQAQVFRTSWEELRTTLSDSSLNRMSPLRQRIFEELKISSAYGVGMRDRIEAILREQNPTPALALGQLTELREEFQAVHTSLLSIDKEFSKLHVEYEELSAGEAEIGFSIPECFAKKTFESLSKESREINFIVSAFNEVIEGDHGPVVVKTIASTDWQFFIDLHLPVVVGLSIAMERIVALYKTALDIKKIKAELEAKQVSVRAVEELQKDIDERLEKGLKKLAEEFVNENYKEKNKERKNELSVMMSMAFTKLAVRVDAGVVIEMRAMPPDEPKTEGDGVEANESERASKLVNYQKQKSLIDELNVRGRIMHNLATSDQGQRLIVEKQESPESGEKIESSI